MHPSEDRSWPRPFKTVSYLPMILAPMIIYLVLIRAYNQNANRNAICFLTSLVCFVIFRLRGWSKYETHVSPNQC